MYPSGSSALVCLLAVALGAAARSAPAGHLSHLKVNISEEMHSISESLENLLDELGMIKREAVGRLSLVKSGLSPASQQERIRQTKVSRFVLGRVSDLERESLGMRDELSRLFNLTGQAQAQAEAPAPAPASYAPADAPLRPLNKQEDQDFDEQPTTTTTTSGGDPSELDTSTSGAPSTSSSTAAPPQPASQEAAKLGFDVEALKRLGDELELELEARQRQSGAESVRGVHEQVIKLVDNMVQNYLGNVRRAIQRMTNILDNSARQPAAGSARAHQSALAAPGQADGLQPDPQIALTGQFVDGFAVMRQSVLDRIQLLSKRMHDFTMSWTRAVGKQQSPLIDRIPPRGVDLWVDFWDTVRKQVRRINQEVWQLSRDMARMLTGRPPSQSQQQTNTIIIRDQLQPNLLYSLALDSQANSKRFSEFYEKMTETLKGEQEKLDSIRFGAIVGNAPAGQLLEQQQQQQHATGAINLAANGSSLIDDQDDESTRNELKRNVALREQIQQEINVFSSIFDIMRAFIQRLRESATNTMRDVMQPNLTNNNNNDAVTPGPSVKPQVDKLLGETVESQRIINGQARPVLLPVRRPTVISGNSQDTNTKKIRNMSRQVEKKTHARTQE